MKPSSPLSTLFNPRRKSLTGLPLLAAAALLASPASAQIKPATDLRLLPCGPHPELVSCSEDASVRADRAELDEVVRSMFRALPDENFEPGEIFIRYLGRVRQTPEAQFLPNEREATAGGSALFAPAAVDRFRAISPGTGNEFEIDVPRAIRDAFDRVAAESGAHRENRGSLGLPDSRETPQVFPQRSGPVANAYSGGTDSRVVLPGNSTTFPWVAIANIGGCTATFVGPRHLLTAAHCLYSRSNASFSSQYTIQPGRTATTTPYQTTIPGTQGTGKSWIFVPPQWLQASPAGGTGQYDFGIMVTPDRLASQFGHLGYGTLSSGALRNRTHLVRGYPWCESETSDDPMTAASEERIDEPDNVTAAANGVVPTGAGCRINDFFGGDACTVGSFSVVDGDGWNRRVSHGCDASAANSGSAVYSYVDGFGAFVSMIHTTSTACAFQGQNACTAADTHPLVATRMTPEYTGWVSWFRNAWQ